jgi:hypothetical protein
LAKAYFSRNYIKDEKLIKKFNAILLINTLRLGNIDDLRAMMKDIHLKIDFVYALKRILRKLYNRQGSA